MHNDIDQLWQLDGFLENNQYVGKVLDDKEKESLRTATPLAPVKEDPAEEMRISKADTFLGSSQESDGQTRDGGAPGGLPDGAGAVVPGQAGREEVPI